MDVFTLYAMGLRLWYCGLFPAVCQFQAIERAVDRLTRAVEERS